MQNFKWMFGALAIAIVPSMLQAALLTAVPMQGGMLMPMVSYHSDDNRLHVMMPAAVPQLAPLLVSNPGDSFDPTDPWFDLLDPSRLGASFSRRYGFMMDSMTDPLPANTQMWIRKLSGPAELRLYRYAGSAPKAIEPVFGTAGVTNALFWDGVMFHPLVTAPPGTNNYSATFELFLVDATSGLEVANSSSGMLTFNWTNIPDGRPVLSLMSRHLVAWPFATATNWVLESADTPNASNWAAVTNAAVMVEGHSCVPLNSGLAQQYFRMRYLP